MLNKQITLYLKPNILNVLSARTAVGIAISYYGGRKSSVRAVPNFDHVVLPPEEHRKLPALEVVPKPVNNQPEMKLPRRRFDSQGPETIHNRLIYRQHGLMALSGGELSPSHIRMIRETVNRHVKENMFAVWRIDPPWKNVTRKGPGKKLGGGKGPVVSYISPVKAGRIIFEFGGHVEFEQILKMLLGIIWKMPFDAMPITQEFFDDYKQELEARKRKNVNPLTLEHAIKNNFAGCHDYLDFRDQIFYGKY